MPGIPPLKKKHVPFKKIREALGDIYERLDQIRPIGDGPLTFEANGFRVKRSSSAEGSTYTPDFSPVINEDATSPTLKITPGYAFIPKDGGTTDSHEIQDFALYPKMPQIGSTLLNAATAPALGLTKGGTNYIYLQFSLEVIANDIGDDTPDGGTTEGIRCILESSDGHDHQAGSNYSVALAKNVSYRSSDTPTFKNSVAATEFPQCTETEINIPWGIIDLDSNGESTDDTVWYRTGPFDFFPQNYVLNRSGGNNPNDEP